MCLILSENRKRNTPNSYIYELIKKLHKPEFIGQTHPERFLNVTYKDITKAKIMNIQATEKDDWDRGRKVAPITNNPRNWRYFLNLRGFLLYLLLVDENNRVDTKKISSIVQNLTKYKEFDFLYYFTIFGNADKVKLLVEIARELKSNLVVYSREYLRYYFIKRCHEEISIWLTIEDNLLIKKFSRFMKKEGFEDDNLKRKLRNYKINILNELIPFQQNMLDDLMIDRMKTKQSNRF